MIHAWLDARVDDEARNIASCEPAKALLIHGSRYRAHSVVTKHGLHLGWVAYDDYPVHVFRSADCLIYIEGRIYNNPIQAVESQLETLATEAFQSEHGDVSVESFIKANDGSYVMALVRPDKRELLVFSDCFCRLPLYFYADESRLIVAREAKFVHAVRPAPAFDRIGCAEVLAFGLPLGDRTVLEGIRSFPDAGVLRAALVDGRLIWHLRSMNSWNLDEEDDSRTLSWHAHQFAELFSSACRNWGSHRASGGNLVSLSGGHDSRAVAAGIAGSGTDVIALTYRDPSGRREDEVRWARELAHALGIEWHCIDVPPTAESAYEELAWLKDGMNYIYMSYILEYLQEIVRRWGSQHKTYLSGDGGDDCLKVTAADLTFRNLEDAIDYVIEKETCMAPSRAEAVLKLPAGTLRRELQKLFESYPERVLSRRIKHFKIFERGRRFYFEGEDRTRSFLWQDSPFYSLALFRHCMRVPDRLKNCNVFCRHALLALSPAASAVPVTPAGYAPASWKYALYHRAKGMLLKLPAPMLNAAKHLAGIPAEPTYVIPRTFNAYLMDQLSHDTPLAALLDPDQVPRGLREINEHSFFCFWSIAMLEKAYRTRLR